MIKSFQHVLALVGSTYEFWFQQLSNTLIRGFERERAQFSSDQEERYQLGRVHTRAVHNRVHQPGGGGEGVVGQKYSIASANSNRDRG